MVDERGTSSNAGPSVGPDSSGDEGNLSASATLLWIPVGAGGHVVVHTSAWWEWYRATRERRPRQRLFHATLEVLADGIEHTIEMTPAWGSGHGFRGVVATGAVGSRWLGRFRLFRFEVRCWPGGVIPDRLFAVEPRYTWALTESEARQLLDTVASVPNHVWGRRVPGSVDMWNSNSLIAWLLETIPVNARAVLPPDGGRAPGWLAGIEVAGRGHGE